jgi:hypothetical protein
MVKKAMRPRGRAGVSEILGTITTWEKRASIRFLGYDPRPEPATLRRQITAAQKGEKLSKDALTGWLWPTPAEAPPGRRRLCAVPTDLCR